MDGLLLSIHRHCMDVVDGKTVEKAEWQRKIYHIRNHMAIDDSSNLYGGDGVDAFVGHSTILLVFQLLHNLIYSVYIWNHDFNVKQINRKSLAVLVLCCELWYECLLSIQYILYLFVCTTPACILGPTQHITVIRNRDSSVFCFSVRRNGSDRSGKCAVVNSINWCLSWPFDYESSQA